jgi:hypothetical protein
MSTTLARGELTDLVAAYLVRPRIGREAAPPKSAAPGVFLSPFAAVELGRWIALAEREAAAGGLSSCRGELPDKAILAAMGKQWAADHAEALRCPDLGTLRPADVASGPSWEPSCEVDPRRGAIGHIAVLNVRHCGPDEYDPREWARPPLTLVFNPAEPRHI